MPTVFDRNSPQQHARRLQIFNEARGYYTENYPVGGVQSSTILVSQSVYYLAVPYCAGDVVSSIWCNIAVVGSTLTLCKVGLYPTTGTLSLLAASGDVSSTFAGTTGYKPIPLTLQSNGQPYVIPADGMYYHAVLNVGTTPATLFRAANGLAVLPNGVFNAAAQSGQADLPATGVPAQGSNLAIWTAGS